MLFLKRNATANGSAFVKLADAEVKQAEIKGRISAIDAAHVAHHAAADLLEKESARVHEESAKIHNRFDAILATL